MGENSCVVCVRRVPERGCVCELDRNRITTQLADVPRKMARLTLQLVPSGGIAAGERVAVSRTGSPVPARLDVLSLVGPGSGAVSAAALAGMLHPKVHKWRTLHPVTVQVVAAGQLRTEERHVVVWHQEIVRHEDGQPHLVLHDDQIGLIPPGPWLRLWARRWQRHFGHSHHRRTRGRRPQASWDKTEETPRRALADVTARQRAANTMLGLRGNAPITSDPDDLLAAQWEILFGEPVRDEAPLDDVDYLTTWFGKACEEDLQIAAFATELRSLSEEMTRVLGERPDQQWLGRCPAMLTDHQTGTTRPCGAGLWQDPYASQVACTRCRCTWGPARVELLHLAATIRKVWPVDRRRRYTTDDIEHLDSSRPLRCPACGERVHLTWREVTGVGDRNRFWRPQKAICPGGCPDAGRLL